MRAARSARFIGRTFRQYTFLHIRVQGGPQVAAGPRQERLDCLRGQLHRLPDFLVTHPFELRQQEGHLLALAQRPDGLADDPIAAAADYERQIADAGGIDIQILGIGADGHLAFNMPMSSLVSRTRLKTLTTKTRQDNARFFDGDIDQVPRLCLTQGLGTIMESRHAIMLGFGKNKAQAVAECVEGAVSAHWPASILQMHPHATVVIDEDAASQLRFTNYYIDTFNGKPDWQGI